MGAVLALDGVFWYLSPPAGVCPNGDVCLAGSSGHAGAREQGSDPFPGLPQQQAAGLGCLTFSFLPCADCRYTCHQECRSLIQLDCRRPGPCQSQLSPESTLLPPRSQVRQGRGSGGRGGGRQPCGDRLHLLQRPGFLLLKGFTSGRSCQRGQPIGPVDPARAH